jgi:hypothetical protein
VNKRLICAAQIVIQDNSTSRKSKLIDGESKRTSCWSTGAILIFPARLFWAVYQLDVFSVE